MKEGFAIEVEYIVYASPEKVFNAMTDSKVIEKWSNEKALVELKQNGRIEMFGEWMKGTILNFTENKNLSYTWKPSEWDKKIQPSVVLVSLTKNKAGTKISIHHSQFPSQQEADNHKEGWLNYVFEPLNDFFIGEL